MTRCCVRACPYFKKRPGVDNKGLRCYLFPTDPGLRQKWIDFVDRANIAGAFKISKQSGVCSAHFIPEDMEKGKKLKDDAVPTVAPEMTPELAFKLGVARSAQDFIRNKQMKEEPLHTESDEENSSTLSAPSNEYESSVQPSTADSSTILVQVNSQCRSEPQLNAALADKSNSPVQRIPVLLLPVVKFKENVEIRDEGSSTDSCYSDGTGNDCEKLEGPPPLLLCKAELSDPAPSQAVTINDIANTPISRSHVPCNSNAVSSSTGTITSGAGLLILSGIFTQNASNASNILTKGTESLSSNIVDRSAVLSSTNTNTSTNELPTIVHVLNENNCIPEEKHEECLLPKRSKRVAYVRDLSPEDFNTPEKARRSLNMVFKRISRYQTRVKIMSQKLLRANKKIQDLESLLKDKQKT